MRMTKKQAVDQFRADWADLIKSDPSWKGDVVAKRCSFVDFIDYLHRDGLITDSQADNWSNPF